MVKEIRLGISKNIEDLNNFEFLIDEFTDFLFSIGAISVSYEFLKPDTDYSKILRCNKSKLCFNLLVADSLNQEKFMLKVLSKYDVNFETSFTQIPDIDWVLSSQTNHKPICILNKIWIGASWHIPPNHISNHKMLKIFIDPGQAFGTGYHPTTRFCLEALIKCSRSNKHQRLLDLGCGSGILSIAACKLGFTSVTAVDKDMLVLKIAKENILINNIEQNTCSFFSSIEASEGKFDFIISNILSSTLLELSSLIVKKLKKNGSLVLSGILKSQVKAIKEKYLQVSQNTIFLNEISSEDNWVCLASFKNYQSGD